MKYEIINSGKIIKLSSLIFSNDISNKSIIQIFDAAGRFIAKGRWYQDQILDWYNAKGIVTKVGTGLTISFKLA